MSKADEFSKGHDATERPECVDDEHLEYLDVLRESGATNMYGAAPYLRDAFSLPMADARTILGYWMRTFAERHKAAKE